MRIEPNITHHLPAPLERKPSETKTPLKPIPAYKPPPPPDMRGYLVDKYV